MSTRILTTAALLALSVCTVLAADDGPSVTIPFDEACRRAEKDSKLVFIHFYETGDVLSGFMDNMIFADEGVVLWLRQHAIALKIDAEEASDLVAKYSLDEYPTLLFAKPDGSELGRVFDVAEPEEFLAEAAAIKAGKSPLERANERLRAAGEDDPMARMRFADDLVRLGRFEEALKEYLWCFDEGNKHSSGFFGVRHLFLVDSIASLGQKYPAAFDELRKRRDRARKEIQREKPRKPSLILALIEDSGDPVEDFAALNEALGEEDETIKLFDQMRVDHPDWPVVERLREEVFEILREGKQYSKILEIIDVEKVVEQKIASKQEAHAILPEERRESSSKVLHLMMFTELGKYYEVLIGAKEFDRADKVATRFLAIDDSASNYNILAWNGLQSGQPTKANLAQARKALELSEGKDAQSITTLARVLDALGNNDEACEVLRTSGKNVTSQGDRMALLECMADLECQDTLIE